MISFKKKLLVTNAVHDTNKNGDPVTYVTVLGDDYKTSDIYVKGTHQFERNKEYNFDMAYNDTPWKFLSIMNFEPVK